MPLPVAGAGLLVVALVAAAGWVWALPRWYRPPLHTGEAYGIDVSRHQGAVDWAGVGRDGVRFAYIKATEGEDFRDPLFGRNWAGAGSAGLARGAYHFFTLCSPGTTQAANFLTVLPPGGGDLPPAVDLEFAGCATRPSQATVHGWLDDFVRTVEERTGKPVVVYSVPSFEQAYPVDQWLAREHWTRRLFRRPDGTDWTVWQASDKARVSGVSGPVDLDVMRTPVPAPAG